MHAPAPWVPRVSDTATDSARCCVISVRLSARLGAGVHPARAEITTPSAACVTTRPTVHDPNQQPHPTCSQQRVTDIPISTYETGTRNVPELWRRLEAQCIEGGAGCDVLAIPHNPNLSAAHVPDPSRVESALSASSSRRLTDSSSECRSSLRPSVAATTARSAEQDGQPLVPRSSADAQRDRARWIDAFGAATWWNPQDGSPLGDAASIHSKLAIARRIHSATRGAPRATTLPPRSQIPLPTSDPSRQPGGTGRVGETPDRSSKRP